MSVFQTLQTDMVTALKHKDAVKVATLRGLKAAIQKYAIDNKGPVDDDQRAFIVLRQEAKKREDSIASYTAASRSDLADQEKTELEIIKTYLPAQLSEADVRTALEQLVANSVDKQFGALMKQAVQQFDGRADGKLVSTILKSLLA